MQLYLSLHSHKYPYFIFLIQVISALIFMSISIFAYLYIYMHACKKIFLAHQCLCLGGVFRICSSSGFFFCTISLYIFNVQFYCTLVQSLIACQGGIWASARISTRGRLLKLVVVILGKIPDHGGAKLLFYELLSLRIQTYVSCAYLQAYTIHVHLWIVMLMCPSTYNLT